MQDHQLYQQILGITSPWHVERVELKLEDGEVHVYLGHADRFAWKCPECEADCPLHDHQPERVWRHLDTCQYQTLLHADVPRTRCAEHGVRLVRVPWAEPQSRFTALFERLAIDWLGAASQTAVAARLGLSWDEVHGIMERAVARGLKRRKAEKTAYLGVDEKAFRKGHRYATIELRRSKLKTARAWALKEQAMVLWDYRYEAPARKHFDWWYRWATHSRLQPMIDKAKMLKSRLANILTYLKHPITNATSESLNAKIQWVKYTARGFRNFGNFATAIYFHCGGLNLSPSPLETR